MTTPAPEPTATAAATNLVGQVVSGRYLIQRLLGEGGMGSVYLAEHTLMRKRVALKLLHAEMGKDAEVLARFRREAEAAAHVEHPNVASATDFGQTEDGAFFLVLEYVEGTSLRDVLTAGALPAARALHVTRQIALALERAHGAGIVHRDLKPENVMLVQKGDDPDFVKVLDFGIAKIEPSAQRDAGQPLTRHGTILGTPEYMAPEQALGEAVGPGADFYAVGVMLYEMLTGRHPFETDDRMAILSMHIVAPVPKMGDRNPAIDVPPPIEELTRRLLEKEPKLRPERARALVDAIDLAAAQAGVALPHAASARSFARESRPELPSSPKPEEVAPPSARSWSAGDATAKTAYGTPASAQLPTTAGSQRGALGIPTSAALSAARAKLVERVRRLPRGAAIAMATVLPVLVLVLIVTLIATRRSGPGERAGGDARPGTAAEQATRATRAATARLEAAKAEGSAALEALAEEYPEDPAVHRQLALALGEAGRTSEMLRVVRALARLDGVDDAIVQAVVAAAQRADAADEAFAVLEGPLGARGVDALLDLSTNKAAPAAARSRAKKSLAREDVRANASPSTSILLDFTAAKTCAKKHDLLDRVKDHGDARLLAALQAMKSPRGCGFMGMRDCWGCMRKDDALGAAIKAVTDRPAQ